ncbi:uncharacterized protein PHACADRAFT_246749 [Phanerochaete carnosa HHB-10118-sp]|uniref:AB hydrolase-1 domain-containing protein n=1 Tax=Phanerochaete carnosa (strain HHB-10118-sp) TaxID=650164 RepID=K5WMK8_PHACS|nr:uncharacterized protein PHACADRAFT_246749 [Phanerochaete carnosa HHB-10118-sp]EKM60680.1 hypothetical protein PHACADRAFT_246749 [Phanerochaete carnosa HHB-10118-sp]
MAPFTEIQIPFAVPDVDKPCFTYCKIFGNLKTTQKRPLVVVHGGPGMNHDYLLPVADLADDGVVVIFYDQFGGGRSTHLPEKNGDTSFWVEELFLTEFDNVVRHLGIQDDYNVLGQSWGGMLMGRWASRQPKGLHRLVIANSPASMELWVEAANYLLAQLPQDVQDTLNKHEDAGTTDSQEYKDAMQIFYDRHVCRIKPMPEEVAIGFRMLDEDSTVYSTMNGPSEFHITGPLQHWSMLNDAHKIAVPTLLINGLHDEARDSVVAPWFQRIPKARWFTFPNSSHMPQFEERERYVQVVQEFLYGPYSR